MSSSRERASRVVNHPVIVVATICAVVQISSATFFVRDLQTPNSSTQIAQSLASDGQYAVQSWHRLRGPDAPIPAQPLRAFQLPGEPLYLAAGFKALPAALWRYLHIPVTVALVASIATVALALGGTTLALTAGLVAAIDPFIIVHGPVWDDTFLGAAAEWTIVAVLLSLLANRERASQQAAMTRAGAALLIAGVAALGAAARLQSQVVLISLGLVTILSRQLKPVRHVGWAVVIGVLLSVGAWGVRNAVVLGDFLIGTTHDGLTLYESNYADARESTWQTGTEEGLSETHLTAEFARVASLGEVDADRQYKQDAWQYIFSNPGDVAKTAALKLLVTLTGANLATPLLSPRNAVTIASNLLYVFLGAFGLTMWWRRSRPGTIENVAAFAFALVCVTTVALLVLGPVGLRYRISLAGFLYIGVSAALVHVGRLAFRFEDQTAVARRLAW